MNMTTAKRTTNKIFKIAVLSILIIAAAALYLPSESSAATKKNNFKNKISNNICKRKIHYLT